MWSWTIILSSMFCSGQTAEVNTFIETKFTKKPINTKVFVGNPVILYCCIQGKIKWAQWTKDGFPLGYNRTLPHIERYTMPQNDNLCNTGVDSVDYALHITNAEVGDGGVYECQALGDHTPAEILRARATLTVTGQLKFTNGHTDRTVSIRDTVQLDCCIEGTIIWAQWAKDGFPFGFDSDIPSYKRYSMPEDNGRCTTGSTNYALQIKHPEIEDEGVYECMVLGDQTHPKILRGKATFTVKVPCTDPRIIGENIRSYEPPRTDKVWLDVSHSANTIEIVCQVHDRKTEPTIEWTFSGKNVSEILNQVEIHNKVKKSSSKHLFTVNSTLKIGLGDDTDKVQLKACNDGNQLCRFTCDSHGGCEFPVGGTDVYINMIVTREDIDTATNEELRKLIASMPQFNAVKMEDIDMDALRKTLNKNKEQLTQDDIKIAIKQQPSSGNAKDTKECSMTIDGVKDINLFYIALGVIATGGLVGGVWLVRGRRMNRRALKKAGVPGAKVDVGIQVSQEDSNVTAASGVGAGGKDKAAVAPKENSPRRPSVDSGLTFQSVPSELSQSPTGSLVSGSDNASIISGMSV